MEGYGLVAVDANPEQVAALRLVAPDLIPATLLARADEVIE